MNKCNFYLLKLNFYDKNHTSSHFLTKIKIITHKKCTKYGFGNFLSM
jgi:hypothetical protein